MKDMMQPLVAIRCLTYNHAPYIRQCLDGIVMQKTNFKFEAIVHDDASTDGTADIVREYATKYPDIIKPILETENQYSKHDGSLKRIMNAAISPSAKYIAMCEGDDYWTDPYKLQKQVDFLEKNPEYGLCYTNVAVCDDNNVIIQERCIDSKNRPSCFDELLVLPSFIAPLTWVARKDVWSQCNINPSFVDGTYAIALEIFNISKIYFYDEVTAVYRRHIGSASNPKSLEQIYQRRLGIFAIQMFYAEKYKVRKEAVRDIKLRAYLQILPIALELGDRTMVEESIEYLKSCNIAIDSLIRIMKNEISIRNSYAYKIGKKITKVMHPFRKLISDGL